MSGNNTVPLEEYEKLREYVNILTAENVTLMEQIKTLQIKNNEQEETIQAQAIATMEHKNTSMNKYMEENRAILEQTNTIIELKNTIMLQNDAIKKQTIAQEKALKEHINALKEQKKILSEQSMEQRKALEHTNALMDQKHTLMEQSNIFIEKNKTLMELCGNYQLEKERLSQDLDNRLRAWERERAMLLQDMESLVNEHLSDPEATLIDEPDATDASVGDTEAPRRRKRKFPKKLKFWKMRRTAELPEPVEVDNSVLISQIYEEKKNALLEGLANLRLRCITNSELRVPAPSQIQAVVEETDEMPSTSYSCAGNTVRTAPVTEVQNNTGESQEPVLKCDRSESQNNVDLNGVSGESEEVPGVSEACGVTEHDGTSTANTVPEDLPRANPAQEAPQTNSDGAEGGSQRKKRSGWSRFKRFFTRK